MTQAIRRLILISRPLSYLPAIAIYGAGLAGGHTTWNWDILLGVVFFTLPFGLIAYGINDIADRESDAHNARKGGIDGAVLHKDEVTNLVRLIAAMVAIFSVLFWLTGHPLATFSVIGLSLVSYLYSVSPFRFKGVAGLDSATNAVGILLIYLTGYWMSRTTVQLVFPAEHIIIAIMLFAAAFHAMGAVADYDSDRKAGDHTIATVCGPALTLLLCASFFGVCFWLVGRNHWITGFYLLACTGMTALAANSSHTRLVRNLGLGILLAFPLAILPSII